MKDKKILVISHMYPSSRDTVKGVFVHNMNIALKEEGLDIVVISPRSFLRGKKISDASYEGITISCPRYLSFGKRFTSLSSFCASRAVKKAYVNLNYKPDIILAHTAIPDSYCARRLSEKYDIPYFSYIHGADVQLKVNYDPKTKSLIGYSIAKAKKIFVNSSKIQKKVRELFDYSSFVIPMGVPKIAVSPKKHKKLTIISVGNLEEEKGIQYALSAVEKLQKNYALKYKIIGDGLFAGELKKIAKGNSDIDFLGRLTPQKVYREMASSDIFLLPSYNEAFGITYLEAMMHSLPIIGVKGEGVEDIVSHGSCGYLVEPKDSDDIKEKLEILIADKKKRESMGKEGKKIVENYYLWDKIAKEFIKGIK